MTFEEMKALPANKQKELYSKLKAIRLKSKKVNFCALYGGGVAKIAITANVPQSEAKLLHTTYWNRNRAVKQVADACIVKHIHNQAWLFNPVSRFWISLREEKDKFSSLNQSTGVYCFDTWVRYVRQSGVKLVGQFHDEIIFRVPVGQEDMYKHKLSRCIELTNQQIKLNVPLKISVDFGNCYSQIH